MFTFIYFNEFVKKLCYESEMPNVTCSPPALIYLVSLEVDEKECNV